MRYCYDVGVFPDADCSIRAAISSVFGTKYDTTMGVMDAVIGRRGDVKVEFPNTWGDRCSDSTRK